MSAMKRTLLLFLCPLPLFCQPISFGIKAGVPLTDALSISDSRESVDTQRWVVGGTVELKLPAGLSVGADVLYRRFTYSFNSTLSFRTDKIGRWEFPIFAKYRFGGKLVRPFLEAGLAFDYAHDSGSGGWNGCYDPLPVCPALPALGPFTSSQWGAGPLVGGGVEFKAAVIKIAPEFRHTRWQKGIFSKFAGYNTLSQPN
jgi:hypothetical protein